MFHEMVKHISVDTAVLTDIPTAADNIDRCLNKMLHQSRPVYIGVPVDMSHRLISAEGLKTSLKTELQPNDKATEEKVVAEIVSRLEGSLCPIIIADGLAVRNNCISETDKLATLTGFPYFTTFMGKGGPNEDFPNYGGVYGGGRSNPAIIKAVEDDADCVLWIGRFCTDFDTAEFTDHVEANATIDLQRFYVQVSHLLLICKTFSRFGLTFIDWSNEVRCWYERCSSNTDPST